MKSCFGYLVTILFFFSNYLSFGQLSITNSAGTPTVARCGAGTQYSMTITNNGSDQTNIERTLVLPSGFDFTWDNASLPQGLTLSSTVNNELIIQLASLNSGLSVQFNYKIHAGCSYAPAGGFPASGLSMNILPSGDQIVSNTSFTVTQGTNGSLQFDPTYQVVNDVSSAGWAFSGTLGSVVKRSYRINNPSGQTFNGHVNFTNNSVDFPSRLEFKKLEYSINGQSVQSFTPATAPSGSFSYSIPVQNLPNNANIIVTEYLEVKVCFTDVINTRISFSAGCNENENCTSLISNQEINITRSITTPNLVLTHNNSLYPTCIDNGVYQRSVTITNTSVTKAVDVFFYFTIINTSFPNANNPTIVPVESCTLRVHKGSQVYTYTGKSGPNSLGSINGSQYYPIESYIYEAKGCYRGEAFSKPLFKIPHELEKDEYITFEWKEYNCCMLTRLNETVPMNWEPSYYHTITAEASCTGPCREKSYSSNRYPDNPVNGMKNFGLSQSIRPYSATLSGRSVDPSLTTAQLPYSGSTTDIKIQTYNVNVSSNFPMVPENAFIEIDILLEDGLTLIAADNNFAPIGVPFQAYPIRMISRDGSYTWNGQVLTRPALTNQDEVNANPGMECSDQQNELWTIRFVINDLQAYDPTSTLTLREKLLNFLNEAKLEFRVRALCTSTPGYSDFSAGMFLVNGEASGTCTTCRIPVAAQSGFILVNCPGCTTPGVVMNSVSLERTTFGQRDDNNDGVPDPVQGPVPGPNMERQICTVGDIIETKESISFSLGEPAGYTNSRLQTEKGIFIDQLYVEASIPSFLELISSEYEWIDQSSNVQTTTIPLSNVIHANGKLIFHISADDIQQQVTMAGNTYPAFTNRYLITMTNRYRVNYYNASANIPSDLLYKGILTDKEVDWSGPVNLLDASCNELPKNTTCESRFNQVTANNYFYACELSNSAKFLYVPLINNNTVIMHNNIDLEAPCWDDGQFYARYYHPQLNSFPFEYRSYSNEVNISMHIPTGYNITYIAQGNNAYTYNSSGGEVRTPANIMLLPNSPGFPVLQPATKGQLLNFTVNFTPLLNPGVPSNQMFHGDEKMDFSASVRFEPQSCQTADHVVYTDYAPWQNINIVYPWPTVEQVGTVQQAPLFSVTKNTSDKIYQSLPKPATNMNLVRQGSENLTITGQQLCFNIQLQNNPINDPYLDAGQLIPYGIHHKDATNTFIAFNGLPTGIDVLSITDLSNNQVYSDPNDDNVFEIGTVAGPSLKNYSICIKYTDCETVLTNDPFQVLSGWGCSGYPTMQAILAGNTCQLKTLDYTLSSLPITLVLEPKINTNPVSVCNTMEYQLDIRSGNLGEVSNLDLTLTLPNGLAFADLTQPTVTFGNNPPVSLTISNPTASTHTWPNFFTQPINDGETVVFKAQLKVKCDYNAGEIHAVVGADSYCGGPIAPKEAAIVIPNVDVASTYFDNFSITSDNGCKQGPATNAKISFVVTKLSAASTSTGNTFVVTIPQGLTYVNATINGSIFTEVSNASGVITWNLPVMNASEAATIVINTTFDGTVECGNLNAVSAQVVGTASFICYGENCSKSKVIATGGCSIACCSVEANAGPDKTICDGGAIGFAPQAGFTYSWSPAGSLLGSNTSNPTVRLNNTTTTTVTYTLTLTNEAGCTDTDDVLVTVNPAPSLSVVTADGLASVLIPTCHPTVVLQATAGYSSYIWKRDGVIVTDNDGINSQFTVNHIPGNSQAGWYSVEVANSNGCSLAATIYVADEIKITGDDEICPGENAALNVTIQGIIGEYLVQWFKDDGYVTTPDGLAGNYYAVLVLPTIQGCTLTTQTYPVVLLPTPAPYVVTPEGPIYMCDGDPAVELTATKPVSSPTPIISAGWNNGGAIIDVSLATSTMSVTESGSYSVMAVGQNGCTSTSNYVVVMEPCVNIVQKCLPDGSTQLIADLNTSGGTFVWTDNAGNVIGNTPSIIVNTDGIYNVSSPDFRCDVNKKTEVCRSSSQAGVGVNLVPEGDFDYNPAIQCATIFTNHSDLTCTDVPLTSTTWPGHIKISTDAGQDYPNRWEGLAYPGTGDNKFLLVDGKVTAVAERVWYKEVFVEECATYSYSVYVDNIIKNEAELPKVSLRVGGVEINRQTVFANQPQWVLLNGTYKASITGNVEIAVVLEGGGWVGRDIGIDEINFSKLDCSSNLIGDKVCNAIPYVATSKTICAGASVTLGYHTEVNGVSYLWKSEDGTYTSTELNPVVSPTQTTAYNVLIVDAINQCSTSTGVLVKVIEPKVDISYTNENNCQAEFKANAYNGAHNVTYHWFINNVAIENNTTGIFRPMNVTQGQVVKCVMESVCTNDDFAEFTVPDPIFAINAGPDKTICYQSAVQIGSAPEANVTYSWSPETALGNASVANPMVLGLETTTSYILTATNSAGCKKKDTVKVTANTPVVANVTDKSRLSWGNSVSLNGSASGGTGPYTYVWQPATGLDNPNIANPKSSVASNTTYTLTVIDAHNCTDTKEMTVYVVTSINITRAKVCSTGVVTLTAVTPGVPSDKIGYQWQMNVWGYATISGATSQVYNATSSNAHRVLISTDGGPVAASTAVDAYGGILTANFYQTPPSICEGLTTSLNVQASNGRAPYEYVWTAPGEPTEYTQSITATPEATKTYTVTITDEDDCIATNTITVTVNPYPAVPAISPSAITICQNQTATLSTTATGVSYQWKKDGVAIAGATSSSYGATQAGNYTVTVTSNGCSSTSAASTVTVTPLPASNIATWTNTMCKNQSGVIVYNIVSGVSTSFTYPAQLEAFNGSASTTQVTINIRPKASAVITTPTTCNIIADITSQGCTRKETLAVTIYPAPSLPGISASNSVICQGGNALLTCNVTGTSYQWYANWTPITGATASSALVTAAGNYRVSVTNNYGCAEISAPYLLNGSANEAPRVTLEPDKNVCPGSVPLKVGQAINLNGTNDYVDVPNFTLPANSPVTIEFWVNVAASDGIIRSAFTIGNQNNPNRAQAHVPGTDNNIYWDYGNTAGGGRVSANFASYVNKWTHVALVAEGSTGTKLRTIYINGVQAGTPISGASSDNGPDVALVGLRIGNFLGAHYHKGKIDDFRIWNKVLSQAEIQKYMYQEVPGNTPNLLGSWRFDDFAGYPNHANAPAADDVVPGNTGTMVGSSHIRLEPGQGATYSWSPATSPTSSGPQVSGTVNAPVTYTVTASAANGCVNRAQVNFGINASCKMDVETSEETNTFSAELYPNPSMSQVNLVFKNAAFENARIEVTNMEGVIVYEKDHVNTKGIFTFGEKLESGIYTVKVMSDDEYKVLKLVISR